MASLALRPIPQTIPRNLHVRLTKIFARRGPRNSLSWKNFFCEALEWFCADNDPDKIPPPSPDQVFKDPPPQIGTGYDVHYSKRTVQARTKIRRQFFTEDMKIPEIASRWGIGESTVRRVLHDDELKERHETAS